jgi:hypothetical protein
MKISFPLLSNSSEHYYPRTSNCPICNSDYSNGIAYVRGGIIVESQFYEALNKLKPIAFLDIGFRGIGKDMTDSAHVSLVDHLQTEQFSLNTCSLKCLRKLFDQIWNELETQLAQQ